VAHPQIAAFARLAGENTPPTRALEGQKTLISRTMHALSYDHIHDEIVVPSPLAQGVLTFRGGANGEEPPIRVIEGNRTRIVGVNDKVSVDPVNNEIYAPVFPHTILVFDRLANGNVPPKRVLTPPGNRTDGTGYQETGGMAHVDYTNNLLLVSGNGGISIFDRTASGSPEPKARITGAGSGQFQITPTGWVVAGCNNGNICAWSIKEALSGNSTPRWTLPFRRLTDGYGHSGIALNPAHKEVIFSATGPSGVNVPGGVRNTVITFSWPEIF
jgi:hypothetical protein